MRIKYIYFGRLFLKIGGRLYLNAINVKSLNRNDFSSQLFNKTFYIWATESLYTSIIQKITQTTPPQFTPLVFSGITAP